jgi:tetratricopeptide (TPR) repeat protein
VAAWIDVARTATMLYLGRSWGWQYGWRRHCYWARLSPGVAVGSRHPAWEAVRTRVIRAVTENSADGLLTEEAAREARELAAVIDAGYDVKAAWALGMFHWLRYESLPDGVDLDDYTAAVRLLAPVYEADPEVVPSPLRQRYERIREHGGAPPPDPVELNCRARSLIGSYQRTAELPRLAQAVTLFRDALAATDGDDSSLAWRQSNLGAALRMLFIRTGEPELLAEAIRVQRDAVAGAAEDERAACRSNLAAALTRLSEATGDVAELKEAVDLFRAVLAAVSPGDLERPEYLANFAMAALQLGERTGGNHLMVEAVEASRIAVDLIPDGHPERGAQLSNLGLALQALSEHTGEDEPLAEAVTTFREAVDATGADHPDRATYLVNLANALQVRHDRVPGHGRPPEAGLLTEAASCYAEAAGNTGAPALARIYAYRQVSRLAVRRGAGDDALAAAEAAVALLPQVTPGTLMRGDRERQLGQLSGLAGDAAAAAVSAGRPDRAAELLEQTRGLLIAETLQARSSDLTKLKEMESGAELAAKFEELRERIDALDWAGPRTGRKAARAEGRSADLYQAGAWQAAESLARTRQQAHQDWEELIDRIRDSGFPHFLQAPGADELTRQTDEGPVVFVFTSPVRCDAVVLSAGPPPRVTGVFLPGLTETEAYRQANQFRDARIRASAGPGQSDFQQRRAAERQISDILAWLWDAIAGPVLAALGYTTTPATEQDWPRLWWCPVGILSYLPLHAAGHHADSQADDPALSGHPRTVLDRIVSSYTPTIRSLAYARAHHPPSPAGPTLIVAVPEAPGTSPLPGVLAEAEALSVKMPDAYRLPEPTRQTVLQALPAHATAHFACHGYANLIDPGASELVMPDRKTEPLTLRDISALQLNARLAYLSACDTVVVRENLADEAVHLTGAFHLAGYQHVIGTLWSINDTTAKELAVAVYARLTGNWTTRPNEDLAAHSLHHATRDLRARYPNIPSRWVTHTHTGA